MKSNRRLKISLNAALTLLFALQIGCTQTIIVFKPNPYIDPMPDTTPDNGTGVDPMLKQQWNLAKIGLNEKTSESPNLTGNYNVKVAILSTGIDYNHEDLKGQVAFNKDEITQSAIGDRPGVNRKDDDANGLIDDVVGYDVVDGDGFAYDRHGAGTAVAGIIAARRGNGKGISGLMKQVTLFPIRYINDNGQTSIAQLAAALEIVTKVNPHVVFIQNTQLRLGGHEGRPEVIDAELGILKAQFDKIRGMKVPVIIGAGDDMGTFGEAGIEKLLRSYDNILVISSTNAKDKKALLANSSFSYVLTAAPGEEILSTKPLNKYGIVSGTAYAAAHVTAAMALAKATVGDKLKYDEIVPLLTSAAGSDQLEDLMTISRGGNRLNMIKFLDEIKKR